MERELVKLAVVLDTQGRRREWVATRLGVSQSTVSLWCSGKRAIPPARVRELADLLGVHEEDIVEDSAKVRVA